MTLLSDTPQPSRTGAVGRGIIVDNFAGGGGASTGIEAALGRAVDIAINHDEHAIRMHEVNHPGTLHVRNNIWRIDPRDVVQGRPVQLAWFSPDCKHFSKAKGGKPREKSIRDLAWVVVLWAEKVRPDVILLENVEEFRTWGPLDDEGKPIRERAGETFDRWCRALRREGYALQFRELRACDYGAPTIRKRFFMIARRDGKAIVWPAPTHGKPDSPDVLSGRLKPWRTAAEIIDWSIPCPSIFDRKKPLAEKTLRRIAHGIMKFVVNNPRPFIVGTAFKNTRAARAFDMEEPLRTATAQPEYGLVVPHVTKFRNGAVGHGVDEPLATVTANSFVKRPGGSAPLGIVEATLINSSGRPESTGQEPGTTDTTERLRVTPTPEGRADTSEQAFGPAGCDGPEETLAAPFTSYAQQGGANRSPEDPLHTVTASQKDHNCVVAAHLIHRGNGEREGQAPRAMDVERPLGTAVAGGVKHGAVAAFLSPYYGEKPDGHVRAANGVDEPLRTQTADNRFGVAAVHLAQFSETREGRKLNPGHAADQPVSTIVQKGPLQAVVSSNLVKLRGTCAHGQPVDEPLHTVSAGGTHMAEVRAFLLKYYGTDQDPQLGEPLHTVTTKDRYGLVTVTIAGEEYVIVDIGMRMLTPRELFNAQGFPPTYIIDRDSSGAPITKTAQVAKCGNSVCPPIAEALVRAQFPAEAAETEAEEAAA
jgi:DNA (cytosine-5)-methyltransferase 1